MVSYEKKLYRILKLKDHSSYVVKINSSDFLGGIKILLKVFSTNELYAK